MKITLEQVELEKAIKDYVQKQGFNLEGKSVDIAFTNGRNATTVDIDIKEISNASLGSVSEFSDRHHQSIQGASDAFTSEETSKSEDLPQEEVSESFPDNKTESLFNKV